VPTKKKAPSAYNIDDLIADALKKNVDSARTAKIVLGGREWNLTDAGSVMSAVELFSGDPDTAGGAYTDWMLGMVVDDEKDEFSRMLRRIRGLDADLLMQIGNAMTEALAERPTEPSPVSPENSGAPVSDTPSTGNSSSPEDLDSETSTELTL
jgi:hypothetical protein